MDASALDEVLDNEYARLNGETLRHLDGMGSRKKRVVAARAELAALRARVEDLELMLHAEWRGERRWFRRSEDGAWMLGRESTGWDLRGEPICPDDGTGLPLLTAEARRALRGEP